MTLTFSAGDRIQTPSGASYEVVDYVCLEHSYVLLSPLGQRVFVRAEQIDDWIEKWGLSVVPR